jgi:hypothetical protein
MKVIIQSVTQLHGFFGLGVAAIAVKIAPVITVEKAKEEREEWIKAAKDRTVYELVEVKEQKI